MDHKKFDWRYYTVAETYGGPTGYYWSAFDAINAVRNGPEWTTGSTPKVISSPGPQEVLTDAAAGNIPVGVTWVTPWLAWSDHASSGAAKGPTWVANVVNAIGENTALWDTSAIFVVWDDWGGWYDHVPPKWLDYDGLGFRVPMLVISPYAKQGYVTHVAIRVRQHPEVRRVQLRARAGHAARIAATARHGSDRRANNPVDRRLRLHREPRARSCRSRPRSTSATSSSSRATTGRSTPE